jgi:hypothetical protein
LRCISIDRRFGGRVLLGLAWCWSRRRGPRPRRALRSVWHLLGLREGLPIGSPAWILHAQTIGRGRHSAASLIDACRVLDIASTQRSVSSNQTASPICGQTPARQTHHREHCPCCPFSPTIHACPFRYSHALATTAISHALSLPQHRTLARTLTTTHSAATPSL